MWNFCFHKCSFSSTCCLSCKQNNSDQVTVNWLVTSHICFWQWLSFAVYGIKHKNLTEIRYKWVWHTQQSQLSARCAAVGANLLPTVFLQASPCQTRQSRVHSLPETRAVWLSSCYWLLFLWIANFCQVIFFPSTSCQNTDCIEPHTQAFKAPRLSTPNSH